MEKILVIRLSSFGDVVQSLVILESLKKRFPKAEIHWLVRSDFRTLVEHNPMINKTYDLPRGSGTGELFKLYKHLKKNSYTHVYDAHNNTRSNLLGLLFLPQRIFGKLSWLERPKNRFKRFLLFKLRINLLPKPFVLMKSYLEPLKKWKIQVKMSKCKHLYIDNFVKTSAKKNLSDLTNYIVMAPSAAWELKRWPSELWVELCNILSDRNIVFLGGPDDVFIETDILYKLAPKKNSIAINLAGKLSLAESCAIIEDAQHCVGGDSGLTHTADSFAVPSSLIIGAAAFSYPARASTKVFDHQLSCKPCSKDGRGRCSNPTYKACLIGTTPQSIAQNIREHAMSVTKSNRLAET